MFKTAWNELKKKKSKLNREKLVKMVSAYISKKEPSRGAGIQIGQEELKRYLRSK